MYIQMLHFCAIPQFGSTVTCEGTSQNHADWFRTHGTIYWLLTERSRTSWSSCTSTSITAESSSSIECCGCFNERFKASWKAGSSKSIADLCLSATWTRLLSTYTIDSQHVHITHVKNMHEWFRSYPIFWKRTCSLKLNLLLDAENKILWKHCTTPHHLKISETLCVSTCKQAQAEAEAQAQAQAHSHNSHQILCPALPKWAHRHRDRHGHGHGHRPSFRTAIDTDTVKNIKTDTNTDTATATTTAADTAIASATAINTDTGIYTETHTFCRILPHTPYPFLSHNAHLHMHGCIRMNFCMYYLFECVFVCLNFALSACVFSKWSYMYLHIYKINPTTKRYKNKLTLRLRQGQRQRQR